MSVAATPLLEARRASLRFGAVTAFEEVSFALTAGELLAVIGPNGAGKTSLFNVLSCIHRPTAGEVLLRGRDLRSLRVADLAGAGVARTLQNLGLFAHLTVLDNVLLGRHHLMRSGSLRDGLRTPATRRAERAHREAAMEVLSFCGIDNLAPAPAGTLPYGMQKRVELARALAMEPTLLLLDEPVAGMSGAERAEVTALVQRLHRERDLSIVLVEHDMGMVMQVAERVLVLDFGRVIANGTPTQVQRDARVIRAYLGEPLEEPA
ncbi:MAG: ABC transporter ATP-binding protein [Candidatus Dormibacteria bacterium]